MDTPRVTSPYCLIQEELRNDPWKLLVACIMLNLTSIKQVRPLIFSFFEKYPTPQAAANANVADVVDILRPLGLYNRRANGIIRMSRDFMGRWSSVNELHGVGKYAADSYRIFVDGKMDVEPTDAKLKRYLEWAVTQK